MNKEEYNKIVNKSGFPFQIAVEYLINSTKEKNEQKWWIEDHELPWKNEENGNQGFIDLIATRIHGNVKLVIECKRVLNEPNWFFLNTTTKTDFQKAYCLQVTKHKINWSKFSIFPHTRKSEYCIIQGNDRSLIESNIGDLVDAIESIALKAQIENEETWLVPVIVTNANLIVSKFEESVIDIKDGKIPNDKNEFEKVGIIRFEKTIKTVQTTKSNIFSDKGFVTCFIINAESLIHNFKLWHMRPWE